jgi:PBP1b-binding outer membrane lipoprotein LpoB
MKKLIFIILLAMLIIAGCTQKTVEEKDVVKDSVQEETIQVQGDAQSQDQVQLDSNVIEINELDADLSTDDLDAEFETFNPDELEGMDI